MLNSGEPADLPKPSILARILEPQVNSQLKQFLPDNNLVCEASQASFGGHSTITAGVAVANDFINALDRKQHCVSICSSFRGI